MVVFARCLATAIPRSTNDLAKLQKLADKNSDGVIDLKEFEQLPQKMTTSIKMTK